MQVNLIVETVRDEYRGSSNTFLPQKGRYSCIIRNELGMARSEVTLYGEYPATQCFNDSRTDVRTLNHFVDTKEMK